MFHCIGVSKNVGDKRRSRDSRFSVAIVLFQSAKSFRRGILRRVSEKFRYRERLWIRGRGRKIPIFLIENFCFTAPKFFLTEPFCAVFQKKSGSGSVYG